MKSVSIRMPMDLYERIEQIAEAEVRSVSQQMIVATRAYIGLYDNRRQAVAKEIEHAIARRLVNKDDRGEHQETDS